MTEKFDLARMLKEIKEDEEVIKERDGYWASQDEISKMVKARKKKKKNENK